MDANATTAGFELERRAWQVADFVRVELVLDAAGACFASEAEGGIDR